MVRCVGVIVDLFIITSKYVVFGGFVWADGILFVPMNLPRPLKILGPSTVGAALKVSGSKPPIMSNRTCTRSTMIMASLRAMLFF